MIPVVGRLQDHVGHSKSVPSGTYLVAQIEQPFQALVLFGLLLELDYLALERLHLLLQIVRPLVRRPDRLEPHVAVLEGLRHLGAPRLKWTEQAGSELLDRVDGPDSASRKLTVSKANETMIKTTKTALRQATLLRGIMPRLTSSGVFSSSATSDGAYRTLPKTGPSRPPHT